MPRCAFLSMDSIADFYVYDDLLHEPLKHVGWQVETVSWRATGINWSDYDLVIIRSPWDYQQDADAFLHCLETIESESRLLNDLTTVKWNISKTYLQDVQEAGIAIVPTLFPNQLDSDTVNSAFTQFSCDELVIKPVISANADHTYRLTRSNLTGQLAQYQNIFQRREFMLQPFIRNIMEEGEYSLFYFGEQFSHAIKKVPKSGDFRVQEEHGGQLFSVIPDAELLCIAQDTLSCIPGKTLYARLDFVRYNNRYMAMELELIEPSLYFNLDAESPQRFVHAMLQQC
ncbi:MAG: RimK family alpha-L-glutamate ligase [Aestuariibacter sp.]